VFTYGNNTNNERIHNALHSTVLLQLEKIAVIFTLRAPLSTLWDAETLWSWYLWEYSQWLYRPFCPRV